MNYQVERVSLMSDYEFTLPLHVIVSGSRYSLNLNNYRNAHYHRSNKAKVEYKRIISSQFEGLNQVGKISVSYEYWAKANNHPDLDNFTSVNKKFFQDAMVELGFIEDDNVSFIGYTSERYMGIDKNNPRIIAKVNVLDE